MSVAHSYSCVLLTELAYQNAGVRILDTAMSCLHAT